MLTEISQDFKLYIMPTVPGSDHNANAASLSDWASELITLLFDQFEAQWKLSETKHSTATTTPSTHSSTAHDSVKLLDSTSWDSPGSTAPILSRPLATILDLPPTV
jgi:hypothetical protein